MILNVLYIIWTFITEPALATRDRRLKASASATLCAIAMLWLAPLGMAQTVLHVDIVNGSPTGNGSNWSNAMKYLQDALSAVSNPSASNPYEIWVAAGTYTPDLGSGYTQGNRNHSFHLIDYTAIYGHFAGTETMIGQRQLDNAAYTTYLSGDLDNNDVWNTSYDSIGRPQFSVSNISNNSYNVVRSTGNNSTAILDGFTIRGGNGNELPREGAGIRLLGSHAVIRDCVIRENTVSAPSPGFACVARGAGVFIGPDGSTPGQPRMERCRIEHNYAFRLDGGGVGVHASDGVLIDCVINENVANGCGGGMKMTNSSAVVTNCIFEGNTARFGGGAAVEIVPENGPTQTPRFVNCIFRNNQTTTNTDARGGGLHNKWCTLSVVN
jgi:hypothetical protein